MTLQECIDNPSLLEGARKKYMNPHYMKQQEAIQKVSENLEAARNLIEEAKELSDAYGLDIDVGSIFKLSEEPIVDWDASDRDC